MSVSTTTTSGPLVPSDALSQSVGTVLANLAQTLRAYQLYGSGQTAALRSLDAVRASFASVWSELQSLELTVTESTLVLGGREVYRNDNRSESLAFLFFRDGIRTLSFQPGFEAQELASFIEVVHRARYCRQEEDDLLTLLWEHDFNLVHYIYVDASADDGQSSASQLVASPQHPGARPIAGDRTAPGPAVAVDPEPLPGVSTSMLERTSLPLEPQEVAYLQQEIARETERDLEGDVLAALIDCWEDPALGAQLEVVDRLQLFVPHLLARSRYLTAARAVCEVRGLLASKVPCSEPVRDEMKKLLANVGVVVRSPEFLQAIAAMEVLPAPQILSVFFEDEGAPAVEALLRAAGDANRPGLESLFESLAREIVMRHPQALEELLGAPEPALARLAVQHVGLMGRTDLVSATVRLITHPEAGLRRMAIETLGMLGTPAALAGLMRALDDPSREVRLAAAWGLGTWQHAAALPVLQEIVTAKAFRAASLNEKVGMLDAYARIGGDAATPLLGDLLHRRAMLHYREPPEMRACAAHALGLLRSAAAQAALAAAAEDHDPAVRTAVTRALARMGEPS